MANVKDIYNKGQKVDVSYDHVVSGSNKTLTQDMASIQSVTKQIENLNKEGSSTSYGNEKFNLTRKIKTDGTFETSNYEDWRHTDYISLDSVSRVTAHDLMNNASVGASAVLYDKNKTPLSNGIFLGVRSVDITVSEYPGAAYIAFQSYMIAHSDWPNVGYRIYIPDGELTALKKDVTTLKNMNAASINKKIVLNGDSLCNQLGLQLMNIAHAKGYDLLNRTRGGENIIGNLTRTGGLLAQVKKEFTMPASGTVDVALRSSWIYSNGNYAETPYNWTPIGGEVFWIKNVKGILHKLTMVAVVAYDASGSVVKTYDNNGSTNTLSSSVAKIKVNINAVNSSGVPHLTFGSTAVDLQSLCTISGYINGSGQEVSNSNYLHSDFISVTNTRMYFDGCATPDAYTFTRSTSGSSFKVGVGTACFDNRLINDRNYAHIWFSGQNMGYDTADEYAEMTESSANAFNDKYLVVTTHTSNCTTEIARAATKKFGAKYLNIREYLSGNAIYDALRYGLISDSSLAASDWETTFLDSGKVHQDSRCAYLEAVQMWNRLVALGIVESEMVDSADYYIDTMSSSNSSKVAYWYNVPEDGYGDNYPTI